jgi:hypothetical protein
MKKFLFLLVIAFVFVSCETPYKIVETYTTDSTGKTIKTVQKMYANGSVEGQVVPQASVNVVASPFWWGTPYYTPVIVPRVIVPVRVGGRRH